MASMKAALILVVLVAMAYTIESVQAVPVSAGEEVAVAGAAVGVVDAAVPAASFDLDTAEHKKKKHRGRGGGSSEERR